MSLKKYCMAFLLCENKQIYTVIEYDYYEKMGNIYVNRIIINSLDVIEQFTYLMFIKQLGEVKTKQFGKIFINLISIKHKQQIEREQL